MVNRLAITGWTDDEKRFYKQLNDFRLSELYSNEGIGDDPEAREDFLLGYLRRDKKKYYDSVRKKFQDLGAPFRAVCLGSLEGRFIYDINENNEKRRMKSAENN